MSVPINNTSSTALPASNIGTLSAALGLFAGVASATATAAIPSQPAADGNEEGVEDEELGDDSQSTQIEPSGAEEDVVNPETPTPTGAGATATPTTLRNGKKVSTQAPLKRTRSVAAQHACPTTEVLDDVASLREGLNALHNLVDVVSNGLALSQRNEREFARQIEELQRANDGSYELMRSIQINSDTLHASLLSLQSSNDALQATLIAEVQPGLQAVIDSVSAVTNAQTQLLSDRTATSVKLDAILDRLGRIEGYEGEGSPKRRRVETAQAPLFRISAGGLATRSPSAAGAAATAPQAHAPAPTTPTRRTTATATTPSANSSGAGDQQARVPPTGPRMGAIPTRAQRAPPSMQTQATQAQPRASAAGQSNTPARRPLAAVAPAAQQASSQRQQAVPADTPPRRGGPVVKIGPVPGNLPIAENAARAWIGALPSKTNLANKVKEARLSLDFRFIYVTMASREVARAVVMLWNEMAVPPVVGAEAEIFDQEN
ncbi:hypothetical protein DFP72DRAFT_931428 [Ephemerocybe angulata]|uniref:Uncharacterized protein n=1 Tax=Ephemerocybe angulata TaxID=980116 RepID=A0A8H6HCQ8_9AGAR|nr:hypothetical protein DFP72DRAFT_931428 [Tulosesus angulatus]